MNMNRGFDMSAKNKKDKIWKVHIEELRAAIKTVQAYRPAYLVEFVCAITNERKNAPHIGNAGALTVSKRMKGGNHCSTKVIGRGVYEGGGFWSIKGSNIVTRAVMLNRLFGSEV